MRKNYGKLLITSLFLTVIFSTAGMTQHLSAAEIVEETEITAETEDRKVDGTDEATADQKADGTDEETEDQKTDETDEATEEPEIAEFIVKPEYSDGAEPIIEIESMEEKVISLAEGTISIADRQEYDGTAKEPEVEVVIKNQVEPLVRERDYTVSYRNNINAGKAVVTVTGKGLYSGTLKKTFTIAKSSIEKVSGFADEMTAVYEKGGVRPPLLLTYNGYELKKGKDYTVTYTDNTSADAGKSPCMTIKGKGNFTGAKVQYFRIAKKPLDDSANPITIHAKDIPENGKAGKYMSAPTLTDAQNRRLERNKDYEIESYVLDENTTPLEKNDIVLLDGNEYRTITVTVRGMGNYDENSRLAVSYKINRKPFANARVKVLNKKYYTGEEVKLLPEDLSVSYKGTGEKLVCGTDYEIVQDSYQNNVMKGTAQVKLRGLGSFEGEKIIRFKIYSAKNRKNKPEPEKRGKVLVAYFSMTGNTKQLAKYASEIAGADLYRIEAADPYTKADLDYNNPKSRTSKEQNDPDARPKMAGLVENMDSYDAIILAYPIWWGKAPKIIYTFVENYDLSDKAILPFCTSGSSGIGNSAKNLEKLCDGSVTWLEGKRFASDASKDSMEKWIIDSGILEYKRSGKTEMKDVLKIRAGENEWIADFADNSSAEAFKELLRKGDVTVQMDDYGNFEKVGPLGTTLPKNDKQITTVPGDVILYQGNKITIYYDTNTWSFTRLAKIRDTKELKKKLGSGSISVTFSISKAP